MHVRRRLDHSFRLLITRTFAAQLHGLGFLLMIAGAAVLLPRAYHAGASHFWACFFFTFTGCCVFLASSVYHFLSDGYESSAKLSRILDNLDHFSIYLFIAGTNTPFVLSAVAEPWRTPLIIGIWAVAFLGITYTWIKPRLPPLLKHRTVSTSLFIVMGWLLAIRIGEIYKGISNTQLFLLFGGAVAYSLGAVVYATKRPKLFEGVLGYHELWHLMVLIGAAMHYFLILSYYPAS